MNVKKDGRISIDTGKDIALNENFKVMIADDNAFVRTAITCVLKEDYTITQAENGNRALEILNHDCESACNNDPPIGQIGAQN